MSQFLTSIEGSLCSSTQMNNQTFCKDKVLTDYMFCWGRVIWWFMHPICWVWLGNANIFVMISCIEQTYVGDIFSNPPCIPVLHSTPHHPILPIPLLLSWLPHLSTTLLLVWLLKKFWLILQWKTFCFGLLEKPLDLWLWQPEALFAMCYCRGIHT